MILGNAESVLQPITPKPTTRHLALACIDVLMTITSYQGVLVEVLVEESGVDGGDGLGVHAFVAPYPYT